ncbi:MAG: VOC family protein [Gaiellaceae bacterium]
MAPLDVFDAGRMAVAQDPTGAAFGIWQAGEHHGSELANEPGSFTWSECQTRDVEAAETFYRAVFGYEVDTMPMGETASYRLLKVEGKNVAGMFELTPEMAGAPPSWATAFAVADTDATCKEAEELGAKVIVAPVDLPDIGCYAVLQDPVGAVFQVLANPAS